MKIELPKHIIFCNLLYKIDKQSLFLAVFSVMKQKGEKKTLPFLLGMIFQDHE